MHSFALLLALAATSLVSAAPIRRASSDTITVFKFAEVLERLETEFYGQALSKFKDSDFAAAGFSSTQLPIEQFKVIQQDEKTHDEFLNAALKANGAEPVQGCQFNFDSVLTDVNTMVATARAVENVGVGAYLGAATLLSNDTVILDQAASILTVEARHQTVNNILSGGPAIFSAFDIPLSQSEVLAIAGQFISGCDLGITANPSLTITNKGAIKPGTKLTFKSDAINGSTDQLSCQMLFGGADTAIVLPLDQCVVPDGAEGLGYVFVTNGGQPLVNNVRDRGVSIAGPAVVSVWGKPELLGSLVKSCGNSTISGAQSVTTQTVSPDAASKIILSTGTAAPTSSSTNNTSGTSATPAATPAANAAASPNDGSSAGGNVKTGPTAGGALSVNGLSQVPAPPAVSAPPASPSGSGHGGGSGYGGGGY